MASLTIREITQAALQSGYTVVSVEQPRANRLILTLGRPNGGTVLVLVQSRPLVGAADVQDLAELSRLRRPAAALLMAHGGTFSPAAHRTAAELIGQHIRLCMSLPPALPKEHEEPRAVPATLNAAP